MAYNIKLIKEHNKTIFKRLLEIHLNAFKKHNFRLWNYSDFTDLFNNDSKIFYYTSNNKIFGFIIVNFCKDFNDIITIAVDNIYQDNNIGKSLMKHIINNPKFNGDLHIEVAINNKKALRFYKKFGFEIIAERKNYYLMCSGINKGKKVDAIVMKFTQ